MATESWVVTGPQVIEIDEVAALRVQVVRGRVDVVAHADPAQRGVRLEVHAVVGRPLEVSLAEGELRVGYAYTLGGWDSFIDSFRAFGDSVSADVHIAVPRDLAVRLGTVGAESLLAGVEQDASVATVSGGVVTDGTRGALSARSVSGDVVVRGHAGDLRFTSVNGDLTAAGDLTRVLANTVAGEVSVDVPTESASLSLTTVSGHATVRLPPGRGLRVEARSVAGRVVVDGRRHSGSGPHQTNVDLPGEGSCFISCSTVSGHLTVLRGGQHQGA